MSDQDNLREWEHNHETAEHFAFTGVQRLLQDYRGCRCAGRKGQERALRRLCRKGRSGKCVSASVATRCRDRLFKQSKEQSMTDLREWEHNHETTEHFAFTGVQK